jgi:hypothetical protein
VRRLTTAWRRRIAVGAGFAAVVAYVHRPWRMVDSLPQDGIDSAFVTWTLLWGGHSLAANGLSRGAWFAAPIFWPRAATLAYSDPFLPLAPPFGLLHGLVGSWTVATGVFVTALVAGNLVATYLLARRLSGRTDAAVLAAVAFALSDFALAQWGHLQIQTMGYLPLGFLLLFSVLERPRWWLAVALGLVQAAMALTAASVALAWAVAAVATTGTVLVLRGRWPGRTTWGALALTAAVSAVVVVPATRPYLDLQEEPAFRRPVFPVFSISAWDLFTPTRESHLLPDLTLPAAGRDGPERELFPGVTTLVLAAVGFASLGAITWRRARRRPDPEEDDPARRWVELWGLVAAGLAGLLVALGHDVAGLTGPYELLHEHTPGFAGLRVSSRFAAVTVLALGCLAAVGYTGVVRRLPRTRARVAFGVVALGYLVAELAIPVRWTRLETGDAVLAVYRALDRRAPGAVVELPVIDPADGARWASTEARRMLYATTDWHPRVNGYSGFVPPGYDLDAETLNTFPDPCALALARRLDVRWIVLHRPAAEPDVLAALPRGAVERHGRSWLVDVARLGRAACTTEAGSRRGVLAKVTQSR